MRKTLVLVLFEYSPSTFGVLVEYSPHTRMILKRVPSTPKPTEFTSLDGIDKYPFPRHFLPCFSKHFLCFGIFLSVYSCFHLRFFIREFASSLLLFEERCSFENWYSGKGQILLDVEIVEKCSNKLGKESNLTHCTVGRGGYLLHDIRM